MSHHKTATGTGHLSMFPSDVSASASGLQFVQNGFYAKKVLEMKNTYQPEGPDSIGVLRKMDPRIPENPNMLSQQNATV